MPEQEMASYYRSRLMAQNGFSAIFSLRSGGISPPPFHSLNLGSGLGDTSANVEANLKRLMKAAAMKQPHQSIQVHGCQILMCSGFGYYHDTQADILISPSGGALAVRIADCLPILLADVQTGMTAAIHAGWRGTVANVACKAVAKMVNLGANPDHMLAMLGPCIGTCCFVIDDKTGRLLAGCASGAANFVTTSSSCRADLREINTLQLRQAGILAEHIEAWDSCTCCDESNFYSYRRDGGKTGRHLAMIAATTSGGSIAEAAAPS